MLFYKGAEKIRDNTARILAWRLANSRHVVQRNYKDYVTSYNDTGNHRCVIVIVNSPS